MFPFGTRAIVAIMLVVLVGTACLGPDHDIGSSAGTELTTYAKNRGPSSQFENRFGSGQLSYTATWYVDPRGSGREIPAEPYQYSEYVSDTDGNYRVQTPSHYVVQSVSEVYICTTDGFIVCARAPRQAGAPNIASVGVSTLRSFSPDEIYEVSSNLALRVAEIREPNAWTSSRETHGENTPVQCWKAVGKTPTAPEGFRVCYTDDEASLMASLDLTGDGELEVDLVNYFSSTDQSQFTPPSVFEDDGMYELLVSRFPDVPQPPEPTPDPNATPSEEPDGEDLATEGEGEAPPEENTSGEDG